jgi:hypothetical protein
MSTIDRSKESSGADAEAIDLARPETLRRLEEIPALLIYEVGASGPHARVVRHGRIRNIVRRGQELAFTFEPDPEHAFLDRAAVLRIADQLGIQQFGQHRTHWAIKDGDIPAELIATGTAEGAQRTVALVAAEYVEACREGRRREAAELAEELQDFNRISVPSFILSGAPSTPKSALVENAERRRLPHELERSAANLDVSAKEVALSTLPDRRPYIPN